MLHNSSELPTEDRFCTIDSNEADDEGGSQALRFRGRVATLLRAGVAFEGLLVLQRRAGGAIVPRILDPLLLHGWCWS